MHSMSEATTRRIAPVALALLIMVAATAAAETKVLTIYFHGTASGIGTGFWPGATGDFYVRDNAHPFTKTSELRLCGVGVSSVVTSVATEGGYPRYKYTVDGFATPACVPEGIDPDWGPRTWNIATTEGLMAIRAAMGVNGGDTWILNLVGHSRGGVLAMTVAHSAATLIDISPSIERINILAYDPVPGCGDPIGRLGPSFILSPKVSQYVGVYAQHHMQFSFEPVIPKAESSSTRTWMPLLPGSHTDLVGALQYDWALAQVGLKIGEQLLTSPNWGEVSLVPASAIDNESEFRSFVANIWTGDYTAKMNDGGFVGFSWLLPCHDDMIRADTFIVPRVLGARLAFVAPYRHDPHNAPWWCGFIWINEERVFWLTDFVSPLTGDGWATLESFRGVSEPEDDEAPTRDPLQDIESGCPVIVPAPTANDNSGTIAGTTTDDLTIDTGGTHVITWTFEDPSHNVLTLRQTVTVTPDDVAPDLETPSDITRILPANAQNARVRILPAELGAATAGDACGNVAVELTGVPSENDFPLGTTTLTYTATDVWGNTASAEQNVTITVDPPAPVNVSTDATSCDAVVSDALLTIPPIEGVTIQRSGVPAENRFPPGTTTVTYTVSDQAGHATTVEQTVTVHDGTPPDVAPLPALRIPAAGDGCTATASWSVIATDHCGPVTVVSDPPSGSELPLGITTVHVTATDPAGNETTRSFDVTVVDETAPSLGIPEAFIVEAKAGECDAVATWEVAASDACSAAETVSDPPSGSRLPLGTTTVRVTSTDDAGNTTSKSFEVTVVDATAPSLTVPASFAVDAEAGHCTAVVTWQATATDDCGAVTVVSEPPSGSELALGATRVVVTATDEAGNETARSFEVTVLDRTPPTLVAPAHVSVPAAAGHCDAVVTWDVTATDSCSAVTIVSVPPPGSTFLVGTTQVVVTATDESGNSTSQTIDVTVTDAEAPSITEASANPPILWSPNHKLVDVAVAYAAGDKCNTTTCSLSVSSNEPENGTGDGDMAPDWEIVGPNLVRLRAERAGTGSGRTYTITISCADAAGNVAHRTVTVAVPKAKK